MGKGNEQAAGTEVITTRFCLTSNTISWGSAQLQKKEGET